MNLKFCSFTQFSDFSTFRGILLYAVLSSKFLYVQLPRIVESSRYLMQRVNVLFNFVVGTRVARAKEFWNLRRFFCRLRGRDAVNHQANSRIVTRVYYG